MSRYPSLQRAAFVPAGLLALVTLVCAPAALPAQQPQGRNLALLVGVKSYEDAEHLKSLEFTENDVLELGKKLQDADYKTVILCDSNGAKDKTLLPTKANIRAQLTALLKDCTKQDTVLIGLAGHGLQFEAEGANYFCPRDTKTSDPKTMIDLKDLYAELDKSGAGVKIVLVDACRNDPSSGRGNSVPAPSPPKGIIAMFSCKEGQRAYETAKYKHGIFFYCVLEGLKSEAVQNEHGEVTWAQLAGYVQDRVSKETPELVGASVRQDPNIKAEVSGTTVVFRPKENIRQATEHKKLGMKAHAEAQYEKAVREFTTAIKLNSKDANLFAARAKSNLAKKSYDAAIRDYRDALELVPDNQELLLARADAYFQNYQHAEAVKDLNEVIRIDSQSALAYRQRGFCFFLLQDFDRAMTDVETAIKYAPKDALGYAYRSALMGRKSQRDRAIQDANTAIRLDATCALAYNCRGVVYLDRGDLDNALKDFNKGLELDSTSCVFLYFNRSVVYLKQGKLEDAKKDIDKGLLLSPRLADGYVYRALWNLARKNFDEALGDANKALEIQARHSDALTVRAICFAAKKDATQALRDLNEAIRIWPESPSALSARGIMYFYQKNYDAALKDLDRSIEFGGTTAENYEYRGGIYHYVKHDAKHALEDYNQALKLNPNYLDALADRAKLHLALGHQAEAAADYQKYRQLGGQVKQ